MAFLSYTEENYLKAIFHLSSFGNKCVTTNEIAEVLTTKPASVSDMLKKLSQKELIKYEKYYGVYITEKGKLCALKIVRKHRLWEVFLVEKLKFNWDEVHDIAEELEHIQSSLLIERLDDFLGFPKYDPHGDPIPGADGYIRQKEQIGLCDMEINDIGFLSNVKEAGVAFLQYCDKVGLKIGVKIKIIDKIAFDNSLEIEIENRKVISVSKEVSKNIFVTR